MSNLGINESCDPQIQIVIILIICHMVIQKVQCYQTRFLYCTIHLNEIFGFAMDNLTGNSHSEPVNKVQRALNSF